MPLLPCREKK